jgi:hypothetical protein
MKKMQTLYLMFSFLLMFGVSPQGASVFLCSRKRVSPDGESLFFACTKGFRLMASYFSLLAQRKLTKRKCAPGRWPLRGFPRHSLLCVTAQHGPSGAGLHWNGLPCPFLTVAPLSSASLKGAGRARADQEQEQARAGQKQDCR